MRSKIAEKILKETPLEVRLKVSNEMAFIMLLSELGYRENKMWDESDEKEMEILHKLCEFAKKHTASQIREIKEWEKDKKENPELT